MSKISWKELVKKNIEDCVCEEFVAISQDKTKTMKISENYNGILSLRSYLTELLSPNTRTAFEFRLGMLDIVANFKAKYKESLVCRVCGKDWEMFRYLFKCDSYKDKLNWNANFDPD